MQKIENPRKAWPALPRLEDVMGMSHWPNPISVSPDLNPLYRINFVGTTFDRYALTFRLPQSGDSEELRGITKSLMSLRTRFEDEMITEKLAQEDFEKELARVRQKFEYTIAPQLSFRYLQYSPDSFNKGNQKIADFIDVHPEYYKTYLRSLRFTGIEARDSVELIVCIPVAAHQERNLTFTLNQYRKQSLTRDKFEIVLFLNCPKKLSPVEMRNAIRNEKEVADFISRNPDFPIAAMCGNVSSHEGTANIGYIRKILTDWTLWRHRDRFINDNFDIIICPHDADLDNLDPQYLEKTLKSSEKHPHKDIFSGRITYSREILSSHPVFCATYLFQLWANAFWDKSKQAYLTGGPNKAFRASAYASVGGYLPCLVGEDLNLNGRIACLRKKPNDDNPRKVVQKIEGSAVYETSTRRAVKAFVSGSSITSQWTEKKTAFSVSKNREIRGSSRAELIKQLKRHRNSIPNELSMLESMLMNEIAFGQRYSAVDWHAVAQRFAWHTGIKIKLDCFADEIIGVDVHLGSYARFRAKF